MTGAARARGDLAPRLVSGVLMALVALAADVAGGFWFAVLLAIVALAVAREYVRMTWRLTAHAGQRAAWLVFGALYLTAALYGLWHLRSAFDSALTWTFVLFGIVWGTDIGAYFAGRAIGGPKIAPRISPSKTWAGLGGGMIAAILVTALIARVAMPEQRIDWGRAILLAAPMAVLAQVGDFFESHMKRRAGMKDSGSAIPGHGGVFDRVDGLLPVAAVFWLWAGWVVAR